MTADHSKLNLRPATPDDAEFAHDLTFVNMHAYVLRHWGGWDRAVFFANYRESENFIGWRDEERVGLARLQFQGVVCVLADLQVLPTEQNKGHGSSMLADVLTLATGRGSTVVRLRVFDDNPARRLYERFGFVETSRDGSAAWLERSLLADGNSVIGTVG